MLIGRSALALALVLCGCALTDHALPSTSAPLPNQPIVLGPVQVAPYIEACNREHARICREFGANQINFQFNFASSDPDSAYSPRCQAFAFPDGKTFFALDTLSETGAVVFDSSTQKIITILPWSRTVKQGRFNEELVFDRTFYRLRQDPSGKWEITALVFAILGDKHSPRYETWEFNYGPISAGHSTRYIMEPRDKPRKMTHFPQSPF